MLAIDEELLARAQLRATGATVHTVANYIATYCGAVDAYNHDPCDAYHGIFVRAWRRLRLFAALGTLEETIHA